MDETLLEERSRDAAKKIAMGYLAASIGNAYLEDAVDDLKAIGMYRHEVKKRMNDAMHYFDMFNATVKWVFTAAGDASVGRQLTDDYEILKESCDRFMGADVRVSVRQAWDSDDLRQPDLYLCRVSGAAGTPYMVMRWTDRRIWLVYTASGYGGGWQALPGVKVERVIERLSRADADVFLL